jgi:glutamine synthetase
MQGMLSFSDKEEIVKFVSENGVKILNLCHIPEDGRLKTLSFSAMDRERLCDVLELGERVDGSSLLSFIEPGKSDIYVMPQLDRAFVNPFSKLPTLNVLCGYLDEDGKPLDVAPRNVLARAEEKLHSSSGIALKALAELEFYLISALGKGMSFPSLPDKNYHESAPFTSLEDLRNEVLATLASAGIATKYGHAEVGRIVDEDGVVMEQHEVEFTPQNLAHMADTVAIAKWVVRNVCVKYGVSVSFSPKISLEHAGSGMHVHLCGVKNGKNVVAGSDGELSVEARKMIGGILRLGPSLAALGNPTPVSYLRFIARKESPMHICWGARNRLALIRIPLWWSFKNKAEKRGSCRETFEYRAPDAFANAHLLFAGLALAAEYGLRNCKESLKAADDLHVEVGGREPKGLKALPCSCSESADNLERDRKLYEAGDVFPKRLIDKTVDRLRAYKDGGLKKMVTEKPEEVEKLIRQYLHYG